jgi:nitrogen fixation/metabolism regulation signal transduction histidine kinase
MRFRRRLLGVFAIIIVATVVAITIATSSRTREVFERTDAQRTEALVQQFRNEFERRGQEAVKRVNSIAASEAVSRMALDLAHGGDPATYVNEAAQQASTRQMDFLEFVSGDGSIISSAQWTARFGYKEQVQAVTSGKPFLKREELQDGPTLGLFAMKTIHAGDHLLYIIGGERLDRDFLATLTLPRGMRAFLYRVQGQGFNQQNLIGAATVLPNLDRLTPLIEKVQQTKQDATKIVHWSSDLRDGETFNAIPLLGEDGGLLGVLLVGQSRRELVQFLYDIRSVALVVGGIGILIAILVSIWMAARITRPVEDLANAAREVGAGYLNTRVEIPNTDEIGELAEAFNSMTQEIVTQRERLLQTERVAAWRELARRLAHELKNPLFPLQITVENLLRARELPPAEFDEIFKESTTTLLAEIQNLKTIVGRFSDFSKMPQPQLQRIQVNEVLRRVITLHEPQVNAPGKPGIKTVLQLDAMLPEIYADADLLHRVFSNLVLNAIDAMPNGGALTLRTQEITDSVRVEVTDTGMGLTPEERKRLFTPYYTSKQHGTGLGLAIVQSVVSDHHGRISVESEPGRGTTFRIDLPKQMDAALKADAAKVD